MRISLSAAICAVAVVAFGGAASADSWKDESGKSRRGEYRGDAYTGYARERGEGKIEFYDRGCEVKREWKRDGSYKEEVKCDGRR
jgi:hypothetical protein